MDYCRSLDGLRAFAVLAVLAFHAGHLRGYAVGGFLGVDVFFVLSGYLISTILLRQMEQTGAIDFRGFWLRRAARLAPALAFFLIVYCLVAPFAFPRQSVADHFRDALLTALYLSDYSFALYGIPGILQHSWSLSVEAHFYLLWPVAMLGLARSRRPLSLLFAAWALAIAWKTGVILTEGWNAGYYRADTRFSGFLAGAALVFVLRNGPWKPGATLIWSSVAAMLWVMANSDFGDPLALVLGGAMFEAATVTLIAGAVCGTTPELLRRLFESRGAVAIGRLSYGLYLWHYPIALLLRERFDFLTTLVLTALLSTLLAALSYATVEARFRRDGAGTAPIRRWRRRRRDNTRSAYRCRG